MLAHLRKCDALVTLAADTAAAVFGGVIALSGIAADLFLSPPDTARQHDAADAGRLAGPPPRYRTR